jgi:hypothetical protein
MSDLENIKGTQGDTRQVAVYRGTRGNRHSMGQKPGVQRGRPRPKWHRHEAGQRVEDRRQARDGSMGCTTE